MASSREIQPDIFTRACLLVAAALPWYAVFSGLFGLYFYVLLAVPQVGSLLGGTAGEAASVVLFAVTLAAAAPAGAAAVAGDAGGLGLRRFPPLAPRVIRNRGTLELRRFDGLRGALCRNYHRGLHGRSRDQGFCRSVVVRPAQWGRAAGRARGDLAGLAQHPRPSPPRSRVVSATVRLPLPAAPQVAASHSWQRQLLLRWSPLSIPGLGRPTLDGNRPSFSFGAPRGIFLPLGAFRASQGVLAHGVGVVVGVQPPVSGVNVDFGRLDCPAVAADAASIQDDEPQADRRPDGRDGSYAARAGGQDDAHQPQDQQDGQGAVAQNGVGNSTNGFRSFRVSVAGCSGFARGGDHVVGPLPRVVEHQGASLGPTVQPSPGRWLLRPLPGIPLIPFRPG